MCICILQSTFYDQPLLEINDRLIDRSIYLLIDWFLVPTICIVTLAHYLLSNIYSPLPPHSLRTLSPAPPPTPPPHPFLLTTFVRYTEKVAAITPIVKDAATSRYPIINTIGTRMNWKMECCCSLSLRPEADKLHMFLVLICTSAFRQLQGKRV